MRTLDDYIAEREARDPEFRAARAATRDAYAARLAVIEARLCAGLTQKELADRIGTTQSAIARLERGNALPKLDTLHKLAVALGVKFEITPDTALKVAELATADSTK